jgi:hypothetical protein
MKLKITATLLFLFTLVSNSFGNENLKKGFTIGTPILKSIQAIAFGPGNILFIGDNTESMVYAIEINDKKSSSKINFNIENITAKIGAAMGASAKDIKILDMAVNPISKNVFFAVSRENRGTTKSALFVLNDKGLHEFSLKNVNFSKTKINNSPKENANFWGQPSKTYTVTDLHYVNGNVIVSGLSNEEFSSGLRKIAFPFNNKVVTTNVQAYHVSHSANETYAPIYRFLPVKLENQWTIVAGYICTPLVTFQLNELDGNNKLVGKTVAEIGAGNAPTGIISYRYNNEDYVLVGNNRYSLTRFKGKDILNAKAIKRPSRKKGVLRKTIQIGSVAHLADYGENVLVITRSQNRKVYSLKMISKAKI